MPNNYKHTPSSYDWDAENDAMRDAWREDGRKPPIKTSWGGLVTDWWFVIGLSFIVWSVILWWVLG